MSSHPAYLHALARILVGAREADQLRADDPDAYAYARVIHRVQDIRRAWRKRAAS